jgi:branched-chain amino acid transport system permease protein
LTVKAFIVSALAGGRGALGTVLAALILGFVETFSSGFFSTNYQDVYVFAAALAVLLFWPEGIGALKSRRYA